MAAVAESLKGRHFTRVADWSREELLAALDLADDLKERQQRR
jgi:ornithine carbamoyltransferase